MTIKYFHGEEISKENTHYTCLVIITIDSIMRMDKITTLKYTKKNANML